MLQRIAHLAISAPRRILAAAVLLAVAAAIFGIPVAESLSASGFQDPTAESSRATQLLTEKFGQGDVQMLITVSAPDDVLAGPARAVGLDVVDHLKRSPHVANVTSAWTAPPGAVTELVSKDGKSGLIVVGITGSENETQTYAKTLADEVTGSRNGITVRAGGVAMVNVQITEQSQRDLLLMESLAIPFSFLVLVWVFGGLLAAALPVAVGVLAILGSLSVLRLITFGTDVSIFALNLTTAMGLALAIDYTLLIISRFRDELAGGADRDEALVRTMATAGRTVLFSATTVVLSMAALVLFPMHFLKSFAYAGVATVGFAAAAAVVVAPAVIVLLGDRLNSLDVRRLVRRVLNRPEPVRRPVNEQFWYRSTKFVMGHAIPIGLAIVALLLVLGAPFLGVRWGFPDDRVLPPSMSAHQVGDQLRNDFVNNSATAVTVVIPDADGLAPSDLERYAAALSRVPDVTQVSAPGGSYVKGAKVGPPAAATGVAEGSAFLTVGSSAPLFSDSSEAQLDRLHEVPGPAGRTVEMTGTAQINHDSVQAITNPAAAGAGFDRGDHVRAAVPADRQRGAAADGAGVQRVVADGGVRRAGVDLPGRASGGARNDVDRDAGGEHAGAAVLCRVRAVDGLRGVPDLADPRVLAGLPAHSRRQQRKRRPGRGPHRAGDHGRSPDHVDIVRRAHRGSGPGHAAVRARAHGGRAGRRDPGADGVGAGVHAGVGPVELVGAEAAGLAA